MSGSVHTHVYICRYLRLSLPPRFMAREGGQTARVELEPTNSTLVAAFFVQPLLTIFGIFSDFGLHATGRRERRVRHGSR